MYGVYGCQWGLVGVGDSVWDVRNLGIGRGAADPVWGYRDKGVVDPADSRPYTGFNGS